MQKYVKNFMDSMGYGEQDTVLCELCPNKCNDIHHIIFRSQGGSDEPENLIALCRPHHDLAHEQKISRDKLLGIAKRRTEVAKVF